MSKACVLPNITHFTICVWIHNGAASRHWLNVDVDVYSTEGGHVRGSHVDMYNELDEKIVWMFLN